jgi:hypothetical protein
MLESERLFKIALYGLDESRSVYPEFTLIIRKSIRQKIPISKVVEERKPSTIGQ